MNPNDIDRYTGMDGIDARPYATFHGWQEWPGKPSIALYLIHGGAHNKSTISKRGLEDLGIDIPWTPCRLCEQWHVENEDTDLCRLCFRDVEQERQDRRRGVCP